MKGRRKKRVNGKAKGNVYSTFYFYSFFCAAAFPDTQEKKGTLTIFLSFQMCDICVAAVVGVEGGVKMV